LTLKPFQLGLDHEKLTYILAAAKGNTSLLSDSYLQISEMLDIDSALAAKVILSLASGDISNLNLLSKLHSSEFKLDRLDVVEAILIITRKGQYLKENVVSKKNFNDLEWATTIVLKQLEKSMGLISSSVNDLTASLRNYTDEMSF